MHLASWNRSLSHNVILLSVREVRKAGLRTVRTPSNPTATVGTKKAQATNTIPIQVIT